MIVSSRLTVWLSSFISRSCNRSVGLRMQQHDLTSRGTRDQVAFLLPAGNSTDA